MSTFVPLQEKAYQYLKTQILTGQLYYDEIYSESKVASALNISRTPVKDALVRLSQDKYVDIIPSKGFRLHKMNENDIVDTFQMRSAIEGFCAQQLASQIETDKGIQTLIALKKALVAITNAIECEAPFEEVIAYDLHFHHIIVSFCENKTFNDIMQSYNHRLFVTAIESFKQSGRPKKASSEHQAILTRIEKGDVIGTYKAMIKHIEISRDVAILTMKS